MKIGNQIILGMFEYNSQIEYTEGDIVFYTFTDNLGNAVRKLYHVKTNVVGVLPEEDSNELYYVDYFKWNYSESNVLTESKLQSYLNQVFSGINYQTGDFGAISISDPGTVRTSGIWRWEGQPEDTNIISLVGSDIAYMIYESVSYLGYRKGVFSNGRLDGWEPLVVVNLSDSNLLSEYLGKLQTLDLLLHGKIKELYDEIEALTGYHRDLDSSFDVVEVNAR